MKKKHDAPATPYQRLMDCPDVQHQVKEELRRRAANLHLVKQKQLVDKAVAKLMHVYQQKSQGRLPSAHAGIAV